MNLIDALLGEHVQLYALFDQLELVLNKKPCTGKAGMATDLLIASLGAHAEAEDACLFNALEKQMGPAGPIGVMRSEHAEIDRLLAAAKAGKDLDRKVADLLTALKVARDHFSKEEQILFRMARRLLDGNSLEMLGAAWAERKKLFLEPAT